MGRYILLVKRGRGSWRYVWRYDSRIAALDRARTMWHAGLTFKIIT